MLLLLAMIVAWYWIGSETTEPVKIAGKSLTVSDGDSFSVDTRKYRLDGIDAPEYLQSCRNSKDVAWPCGKMARAALERLLREPGLNCSAQASDQYARRIAKCFSQRVPDIAAAQVFSGLAVSDEYFGIRSYGDEEDAARGARRGIWAGQFTPPSDWRSLHPR